MIYTSFAMVKWCDHIPASGIRLVRQGKYASVTADEYEELVKSSPSSISRLAPNCRIVISGWFRMNTITEIALGIKHGILHIAGDSPEIIDAIKFYSSHQESIVEFQGTTSVLITQIILYIECDLTPEEFTAAVEYCNRTKTTELGIHAGEMIIDITDRIPIENSVDESTGRVVGAGYHYITRK
jgi:hypothetical protein